MSRTDPLFSTVHRTPVGALTLIASNRGLRAILWEKQTPQRAGIRTPLTRRANHPIVQRTAAQLDEYFAGNRTTFDIPLDLEGTRFQLAAWHALADIPFGATTSYGRQACALGIPTAARAVGAANGANPVCIVLPCHRVIGANGSLTGFGGGLAIKQWLLDHEARVAANLPSAVASSLPRSTSDEIPSPRLRGEGQGGGPMPSIEGWPSRHPVQARLSMPVG